MDQSELLTVGIGAVLLCLAGLMILVGMVLSRTKNNKRVHDEHVLELRTERDSAILKTLADPSEDNKDWMWEKINDYDRQRTSGS